MGREGGGVAVSVLYAVPSDGEILGGPAVSIGSAVRNHTGSRLTVALENYQLACSCHALLEILDNFEPYAHFPL